MDSSTVAGAEGYRDDAGVWHPAPPRLPAKELFEQAITLPDTGYDPRSVSAQDIGGERLLMLAFEAGPSGTYAESEWFRITALREKSVAEGDEKPWFITGTSAGVRRVLEHLAETYGGKRYSTDGEVLLQCTLPKPALVTVDVQGRFVTLK